MAFLPRSFPHPACRQPSRAQKPTRIPGGRRLRRRYRGGGGGGGSSTAWELSRPGWDCGVLMANSGKGVDIQNLLSLGDDLVGVLKNNKDGDTLMQSLEVAKMFRSSCQSDSNELGSLLEVYQEKINTCQEKVEKAKRETIADAELEQAQSELENKLQEEHLLGQELSDELGNLEHQRVSIEEQKEVIKKKEKDVSSKRDLLSMCASVTSIIPNLEDDGKISGYIVDRNKKKVEKFEFESTTSPMEMFSPKQGIKALEQIEIEEAHRKRVQERAS